MLAAYDGLVVSEVEAGEEWYPATGVILRQLGLQVPDPTDPMDLRVSSFDRVSIDFYEPSSGAAEVGPQRMSPGERAALEGSEVRPEPPPAHVVYDQGGAGEPCWCSRGINHHRSGSGLFSTGLVAAVRAVTERVDPPSPKLVDRMVELVSSRAADPESLLEQVSRMEGELEEMTGFRDEAERQFQEKAAEVGELTSRLAWALERLDRAAHEFQASDPDEDDAPADTCRQCGVLQGDHPLPEGWVVADGRAVAKPGPAPGQQLCGLSAPSLFSGGGMMDRCGKAAGHRAAGDRKHAVNPDADENTTFTWEAQDVRADGNIVRAYQPFGHSIRGSEPALAMCNTPEIAAALVELWNRYA